MTVDPAADPPAAFVLPGPPLRADLPVQFERADLVFWRHSGPASGSYPAFAGLPSVPHLSRPVQSDPPLVSLTCISRDILGEDLTNLHPVRFIFITLGYARLQEGVGTLNPLKTLDDSN